MKKYKITLTSSERSELKKLINKGKSTARKFIHARILLKADESSEGEKQKDADIAKALSVHRRTIERVRKRFVEEGFDSALNPKPVSRRPRKIDGKNEAILISLVCSKAPEGRVRWTMQLLADKMVELGHVDSLSGEAVRKALKKTNLNLGKKRNGV